MSKVQLQGNASGTGIFTIASPNSNTDRTLTLPDNTGTLLTNASTIARTNMFSGAVLQTVSTSITTVLTTTSSTWANVTGLSATITPTSSSSKIYIVLNIVGSADSGGGLIKVQRNGTDVMVGSGATGNRTNATMGAFFEFNDTNVASAFASNYLDSPASTSALTYQVLFRQGLASSSFVINRNISNVDQGYTYYGQSSITLFEIAG